jgi:translation initiation factor 1 (eIF-1/SUI1)
MAVAKVSIRHEAVGRSGKLATRISGVPTDLLEKVAAKLAKALGCAANVDGGDVILFGSLKERAGEWFQKVGDLRKLVDEKPALASTSSRPEPPSATLVATNASGTYRRNIRPECKSALF